MLSRCASIRMAKRPRTGDTEQVVSRHLTTPELRNSGHRGHDSRRRKGPRRPHRHGKQQALGLRGVGFEDE
jgi:hypothetical protein